MSSLIQYYDTLEWFEPTWRSFVESSTATFTLTEFAFVNTALISSVALFGVSFFYFLLDFQPALRSYKLQPTRLPTLGSYWKCFKLALANQIVLHGPVMVALLYLWGDRPTFSAILPLPKPSSIALQLLGFLLVEDFMFYWAHRFLHWKKIYKYVHKVHHEYTAPFGLTAVYTHPLEEFVTMMATLTGPLLFGSHIICMWIWITLRMIETIDSHSGYDFPITLGHFVPILSGPARHDYHHEKFDCNYGSTLAFWDWICGTDIQFRALQREKAKRGESAWFDVFDFLFPFATKSKA